MTGRDREILDLLLEGLTNKEIAARLRLSDQTVKNRLTSLYRKARVRNRVALVLLIQGKRSPRFDPE